MFINKKMNELLGPIDNTIVNIVFDTNFIPERFKLISDIEQLRKSYEMFYQRFSKKGKQNYMNVDNNYNS